VSGSRIRFGDYGQEFVGSTVEGGKEAWAKGDIDLGLVAAAERKTRDAARVSLYKKGTEGALIRWAAHNYIRMKVTRPAIFWWAIPNSLRMGERHDVGSSSIYMG
jgi:hypothetical protein